MSGPSKSCCCALGSDCPEARHTCEPTDYPQVAGLEWTCPECGKKHVTFRADLDGHLPKGVRDSFKGREVWGWRAVRTEGES